MLKSTITSHSWCVKSPCRRSLWAVLVDIGKNVNSASVTGNLFQTLQSTENRFLGRRICLAQVEENWHHWESLTFIPCSSCSTIYLQVVNFRNEKCCLLDKLCKHSQRIPTTAAKSRRKLDHLLPRVKHRSNGTESYKIGMGVQFMRHESKWYLNKRT